MNLDGMIPTTCLPDRVAQLLLAPDALRQLLPAGCEVGERMGDTVPFVIRHRVGPVKLSMSGSLKLSPADDGKGYDLVIIASHMVTGRVRIALALMPEVRSAQSKRLRWNGTLDAQGLTARLVEGRGKRVRGIIEGMFANLRDQIEWN